jgi:hypothetical protein
MSSDEIRPTSAELPPEELDGDRCRAGVTLLISPPLRCLPCQDRMEEVALMEFLLPRADRAGRDLKSRLGMQWVREEQKFITASRQVTECLRHDGIA